MKYIGENLLPGQIGHFFLVLSLVASLVATISFFYANKNKNLLEQKGWFRIARIAFLIETISVFAIFGVLYYIISHHLFEYKYAWQHSDRSLQVEYLLSCFWEGQEGSFLLWSFWHCILGWVIIWKAKEWEAGVMTVISFTQFCLATMIVGLYFFDWKMGSNPFLLLRYEMAGAPIFEKPDYLNFIKDGNGLNALLQNYWMVIHPPVLFLGFAATVVPFGYAFAGLMNKNHNWVKFSIPWAGFAGAVLGLGIMMGGMWAYESLSFGGYWAWDPVENASLVPWLTLIAGLHTNMVYKKTGYSLRATYFFYIISFLLVLYSTFLTRSGILGDTSVHAFTDLGMNWQLLAFVLVFLIPSFWLYFARYKSIPAINKEENTWSREFWMFIGSMVLFLSGFVIIFITSLPVFNKIVHHFSFLQSIFKNAFSQPEDAEYTHNQIQVFVAIILGVITGFSLYLKFKDTPKEFLGKKIMIPLIASVIISLLIILVGHVNYDKHGIGFMIAIHLAIFSAVFAVLGNASYVWIGLKGNFKKAGASIAHLGFGMILLGVLISSSKKAILSWNKTGIAVFEKSKNQDPAENSTLFKGISTDMGNYMVTYTKDSFNTKDRKRYFEVDFKPKDGSKGFKVYPDIIQMNKGEGFSANPDSKHYLHKDIFVYLTTFQEAASTKKDTSSFKNQSVKIGDTVYYGNGFMIMKDVKVNPKEKASLVANEERAVFLEMEVISKEGSRYKAMPGVLLSKDLQITPIADTVLSQDLVLKFNTVKDQEKGIFEIGIKEAKIPTPLITLKVLQFPMINVLWIGVLVMVIGFVLSIVQRVKKLKNTSEA